MTVPSLPDGTLPGWDYISSQFIDEGVPGFMVVRDNPRIALFVELDGRRFGGQFETDDLPVLTPLAAVRSGEETVDNRRCLELSVSSPPLYRSFYQLLVDLTARVLDGVPVGAASAAVLSDWRDLLQQAAALSDERQTGLFGELWLLERLIRTRGPGAVESWTGPLRAAHDFRTAYGDVEVKTTYGARRVHFINGLAQLTPAGDLPLFLLSLQLQAAGQSGLSLPEAVSQVRGLLVSAPLYGTRFEQALVRTGYRDDDADLYPARRRLAAPAMLAAVADGFPRLTRAALTQLAQRFAADRILDSTYRLDVEGLGWLDGTPEFLAVIAANDEDPSVEA